ncbi:MAG TPA: translocation/assembly module TamB domain-containing protein [Candidatus Udaeobacter sp.]|nr:translocation/assembly module TamB domain-containing protein [Candidatus Udaeobacter sp.]
MSDSKPPEEEEQPRPHHDLGEDIAHVGEEIAHEIAEVVEHVPEPVRWTIGKLVRLTLISIAGLIILAVVSVALYLAHRTELVAKEVSLVLNQALAQHSDVALVIRDIRGNPTSGFRVISPSVRFRDGNLPPLLEAGSMRIGYSLWGLMAGKQRSIEVEFDHPVVHLSRDKDGHLRLPRWEGKSNASARAQAVRIHLVLHDAEVVMPEPVMSVHQANLDAVALTAPPRIDVALLDWKQGPYATRLDGLRGHAELSDSVRIQISDLNSPELMLSGSMTWARAGGPRHVRAHIGRVRWPLLARVFDNKTFDVPGEASGDLDVAGDRTWAGLFRTAIDWDSLKGQGRGNFEYARGELAISPLTFDSPAGNLRGRVDWSHRGWQIAADVDHGDPERWRAIHITGWPAGDLNGAFRYAVDTRTRTPSARLEAKLGSSMLASWRADSAWVGIEFPPAAPDSFTVRMLRRGGRMVLIARSDREGWNGTYELARFPLDEWEDGRKSGLRGTLMTGQGTVANRAAGLFVTGDLAGTETDWLGIHADGWHLPDVQGRLLPTPDLETRVRLLNAMYLGVHFDSARAGIHVGDGRVALDSVRAAGGDTVVTTAGLITFGSQGWNAALSALRATSNQFDWSAEAPVEMHGDSKATSFDRFGAHDGDARIAIRGQWSGPGGRYDWHGTARALDLGRIGLPREWELRGKVNADLEVQGVSDDPRWSLRASASAPGTHGHAADSLALALSGAPARLEVTDFEYTLKGGKLSLKGRAEGMTRAWPDTLLADHIVRWIGTARSWQGVADAHEVPIDRVGALAPAAEGASGVLGGHVDFRGSPAQPSFDLNATLKPGGWKEYRADEIALRATFANQRLEVPDLRVTRAGIESHVKGYMPLALSLTRRPQVLDQPMSWSIEAMNGDLAVIGPFVPQIGYAAGRFDLHGTIGGTPRQPKLEGSARVHDATVRLAAREELLEGVRADFRIEPSRIVLDSMIAREGQRGRVRASGRIDLDGLRLKDYLFDLKLREFTASEAGLYAALFNGDFVVTNGIRLHGVTLPMVTGSAAVENAAILFDFSNQTETQQIAAATQPLFWTYRIRVEATNHLDWRPPEGDIEFNADLNLEQTRDSLLIYGEMHSLRGNYWYLSNKYAVQNADLTFDNVEGANPQIDVTATTRVTPTFPDDRQSEKPQPHEITVHIHGRANRPIIEFTDTDPRGELAWDQSQILREITAPGFGTRLSTAVGNPLDSYVTQAINRSLSSDLSRAFGGYVNDWSLERDRGGLFGGSGEVIVSAGSQISNRLSLRYSQRLPGFGQYSAEPLTPATTNLFERQVQAEYRLSRFIYLTTDLSQRRAGATSVTPTNTPDYNVNLKARWEY